MSAQSMPQESRPWTPFGKRLFALGVHIGGRTRSLTAIEIEIAKLLGEATAVEAGLTTVDVTQLPESVQEWHRVLARRALAMLDPQVRVDAMAEARQGTLAWAKGLSALPSADDLIAEVVGRYEAALVQRGGGR